MLSCEHPTGKGPHMRKGLTTIVSVLQLTRLALVWTAISDIWLVVLWSRWIEHRTDSPWQTWEALGLSAGVAIGIYIFGMVLNDVLDVRRDRLFAPDRPIPSRRISVTHAVVIALLALLLAILCSVALGTVNTLLCLACATLIVFYNAAGKYLPALGLMTLGLIRATHMLIAEPHLATLWPVWAVMTHVTFVSMLCHRLERKRPPLAGQEVWAVLGQWAFITLVMIAWMAQRDGPSVEGASGLWHGPAAAGLIFALIAVRIGRNAPTPMHAGKRLMRWGLGWLIVYDLSWFVSAELWRAAMLLGGLAVLTIISVYATRSLAVMAHQESVYESDRNVG